MNERNPEPNFAQNSIEPAAAAGAGGPAPSTRPSLAIRFACANLYQRVLRDADGSGYTARCAKCGIMKRFVVGPGGTGQREFVLDCGR